MVVESQERGTASTFMMDRLVPWLIVANLVAVSVASVWPGHDTLLQVSWALYALSTVVFSVEYVVRVSQAPAEALWGRLQFMASPMMLIDLLALISVPFFGVMGNAFFLRVFRLFKLAEGVGRSKDYSPAQLLLTTFGKFKEELLITVTVIFLGIAFVTFAVYFIENRAQPEVFADVRPSFLWAMTMVVGGDFSTIEPVTTLGQALQIVAVIFSIAIVAAPIGIIGGGFVDQIAEVKARQERREHHALLKTALQTHAKISERKLVADLGLETTRKFMTLEYINTRMGLTDAEIYAAVRELPGLRVRVVKRTIDSPYEDMTVVETFTDNVSFGALKPGERDIVVVATQNSGDVFSGHWTETLASALGATYIANQHYSSGSPLEDQRINFSAHDAYLPDSDVTPPDVVRDWMTALETHIKPTTLVLNVGTSGGKREDFMVLFGGKKGQSDFAVEDATIDDLGAVQTFVQTLQAEFRERYDYGVITHETFGNTAARHLSQYIRRATGAQVITPRINVRLLWFAALTDYYGTVHTMAEAVLEHLHDGASGQDSPAPSDTAPGDHA